MCIRDSSYIKAFNKKKRLLCVPLDGKLRKRTMKCFVCRVLLHGRNMDVGDIIGEAVTGLQNVDVERIERLFWKDRLTNEEMLGKVEEKLPDISFGM